MHHAVLAYRLLCALCCVWLDWHSRHYVTRLLLLFNDPAVFLQRTATDVTDIALELATDVRFWLVLAGQAENQRLSGYTEGDADTSTDALDGKFARYAWLCRCVQPTMCPLAGGVGVGCLAKMLTRADSAQ